MMGVLFFLFFFLVRYSCCLCGAQMIEGDESEGKASTPLVFFMTGGVWFAQSARGNETGLR